MYNLNYVSISLLYLLLYIYIILLYSTFNLSLTNEY